jgi:hypothetical protein
LQDLLTLYKAMWCNISLKIHFVESHLDFVSPKISAKSEERFCLFHEHVKYCFGHLNSSVPLKPCLIEAFLIHIWIHHKEYCQVYLLNFVDETKINFVDNLYAYLIFSTSLFKIRKIIAL